MNRNIANQPSNQEHEASNTSKELSHTPAPYLKSPSAPTIKNSPLSPQSGFYPLNQQTTFRKP
ncbi:hypothetical protein B0T17DRAFT_522488 [Bombardia bombarda]|uniref:Uncharacterized protein n=1 Tax=Bombardia bombarda TaxID=252184 RepID=A0AA40C801_9PEZI|nr:hypothetical protein B0T17DRAFT_522488 [Bombardia bombarda]